MTSIRTSLPATEYEAPSPDEFPRLAAIVRGAASWIAPFDDGEFVRSMWATGHFFRTPEPRRDVYVSSIIESANELLDRNGARPIDGPAFWAAVLAHGDVVYQRSDTARGILAGVGLHATTGRRCQNLHRDLLSGANIRGPFIPPDPTRDGLDRPLPLPSFYREENGQMRRIGPTENLW